MRLSEFRRAVLEEFGEVNGAALTRELWLTDFSSTADEAIAAGVSPREVWLVLCREMDVPLTSRHGRGLIDPATR